MKTKSIFLLIAAGITAFMLGKRRSCNNPADEISLANIRRGIKNNWYSAQLLDMDGKLYVQLTGTRTDGSQEQSVYEISQETFNTLKVDGVEQIV